MPTVTRQNQDDKPSPNSDTAILILQNRRRWAPTSALVQASLPVPGTVTASPLKTLRGPSPCSFPKRSEIEEQAGEQRVFN
ncbi:hypothetical protein CUMW_262470 [Citrus unshiu]|uniref:Uncharacterized protein n=1 Tax=Citrus unshiu TaxID=55188 RepID=A0A2H5QUB8_CITUN|nr:hypothetical protein CUMW_262470 [Citrus unshiu]